MTTDVAPKRSSDDDRKLWIRRTLLLSRREASATATTTAVSDNFLNAFAIHLQATMLQMSWLTAIPQLVGAFLQLLSIWLDRHVSRRRLVVGTAILQGIAIGLIAILALLGTAIPNAVTLLISLSVLYQAALNLNQPHWRAWLGRIVPPRRRGAFFAGRSQLTMLVSMLMFMTGGVLLSVSETQGVTWLGFALLFAVAAGGRLYAAKTIAKMHDPDHSSRKVQLSQMGGTLLRIREAWADPTFRRYSLFIAGMQGAVAVSAPFFAVYMLSDLNFTYVEYTLNSSASIATQFLTLRFWGHVSDRYGNRLVMRITSFVIPIIPFLWLVSPNYAYLIGAQILSGLVWSGYSLSAGNYLYDIRPGQTHFATYSAVQSIISAGFVLVGALLGGAVASVAPAIISLMPEMLRLGHGVFVVFILSGLLRFVVVALLMPKPDDIPGRPRPKLRQLIFRVSRINSISGLSLDWVGIGRRERDKQEE